MPEITHDRIVPTEKTGSSLEIDQSRIRPLTVEDQQQKKDADERFEWKSVLKQSFMNIPSSAFETGKSLVTPLIHPVETGKSLGRLGAGLYQKFTPGEQIYEQNVDAMVDFFKNRYGSVEGFKKTVAQDPVGLLTDVASLMTAGGAAIKTVGTVGKLQKVSQVGRVISNAGARIELQNLAKGILAQPLKLIPESMAIRMYQSAVKFDTSMPISEVQKITRTALNVENQIMPTIEGMYKLRGMIDDLNRQITDKIVKGPASNIPLEAANLRKNLTSLMTKTMLESDKPLEIQRAFKASFRELDAIEDLARLENVALRGQMAATKMPIQIQRMKQRIYKELESIYAKHTSAPVKSEIRIAIARNAREMLEDIIPEIKQLNQREGALIALWDAVEKKTNRKLNRDLIGIGAGIKVASGAAGGYAIGGELGSKIGTYVGLAHGVLDNPMVKSRLAIVLNRLKQQGIQLKPTQTAIRLGLVQSERLTKED